MNQHLAQEARQASTVCPGPSANSVNAQLETFDSTYAPVLKRAHMRRLREIYRSAGWPCADMLEVELLAAGLLERYVGSHGHETLRLTDAGIHALAQAHAGNQNARDPHESLVKRVADQLGREGRLAWRGLMLRVPLPRALFEGSSELAIDTSHTVLAPSLTGDGPSTGGLAEVGRDHTWCMAMPDVFSIRRSSVEAYLEPVVHEIKVSRADLLGDLRKPAKRAAYQAMAGAVWYVLGEDAKGRPIAKPEEVPPECGVLQAERGSLVVARNAPRRSVERLPFHVWMALAQAGPHVRPEDNKQALL